MEDFIHWGYDIWSAITSNFIKFVADFKIEPFYNKNAEQWADHRPSITYYADGSIYSMKKCPPIYHETQCSIAPECPAYYTDEQFEDVLITAVGIFGAIVVFLIHIILLCFMTEDVDDDEDDD